MCLLNILRWWPMWYLYEWIVLWCCAEMYSIGLGEDWVKAKVANRIICIYNIYIGIQVQQQNTKHTETHLLTWHTKNIHEKIQRGSSRKNVFSWLYYDWANAIKTIHIQQHTSIDTLSIYVDCVMWGCDLECLKKGQSISI